MSFDQSGFDADVEGRKVSIDIGSEHPLIKLGKILPWKALLELILPDLKATTVKGQWWRGRALHLRIHLAVYLLQQLFNKTDRQMEFELKSNAAYQLFTGLALVKVWHCPDHTKIEDFRSRLQPETQRKIANLMAEHATQLGFADASNVDIDSTIQEANMQYPADSQLLCKLAGMAKTAAAYMNDTLSEFAIKPMEVNLKRIKSYARRYFFLKKTAAKEQKHQFFKELYDCVVDEIKLVVSNARCTGISYQVQMPWNIKRAFNVVVEKAQQYLTDVAHFIETGHIAPNKKLSFHLDDVKCFNKNKLGKKYEFGRAFQLGRIKGNFFFAGSCTDVQMNDKSAIPEMLNQHDQTFSKKQIDSLGTDKGYFSKGNIQAAINHGIKEIGIQYPCNVTKLNFEKLTPSREQEITYRRAGIEPLIGHVKQGGQLGKSRMKSDRTILASGYSAVLGFNLRQLSRNLIETDLRGAA